MVAPPVAPPSACIERDAYSAATDVLGGALLGSVVCTAPAIDVAGDVAEMWLAMWLEPPLGIMTPATPRVQMSLRVLFAAAPIPTR